MTDDKLRYTVFIYKGDDGKVSAYYGKRDYCERFIASSPSMGYAVIGNFKRLSTAKTVAEQHHTAPKAPYHLA